jgi:hypothetical protein
MGNDNADKDVPIAMALITRSQGHPTPSTSRVDPANASQYRHLTVQPHLRVVKGRSSGSRYHNRHVTVQPHLWVVQISWVDSANVSQYHHHMVKSHL